MKREKPEEIVSKLRQVEVLHGKGMTVTEAVRQIGVTQQTFYRRCKLYGGIGLSQQKQLKNLEKENQRLGGSDLDENAGSVLSDNQHSQGRWGAPRGPRRNGTMLCLRR